MTSTDIAPGTEASTPPMSLATVAAMRLVPTTALLALLFCSYSVTLAYADRGSVVVVPKDRDALSSFMKPVYEIDREMLALQKELKSSNAELSSARFESFKEHLAALTARSPKMASYYDHAHTSLQAANALRGGSSKHFERTANILGGELIEGSVMRGKKGKISFEAKADHCYSLLARFQSESKAASIKSLDWRLPKEGTEQHYAVDMLGLERRVMGICTLASTKVEIKIAMSAPGTKNALHVALIGWSKSKFPVNQSAQMYVSTPDTCDAQAWVDLWTRPIPGSIGYSGGEPMLIVKPAPLAGRDYDIYKMPAGVVTGQGGSLSLGRTGLRYRGYDLSDQPEGSVAIASSFEFKGCPKKINARSPASKQIAACVERIQKKFDPKVKKAERAMDSAGSDSAYRRADARLGALDDQEKAAISKSCGPMEKKAGQAMERAFDKIVDSLTGNPPESSGRGELLLESYCTFSAIGRRFGDRKDKKVCGW